MNVAAPKFRFEWNLNTLAVLVGFISGFVMWGYTLADIQKGREENAKNIERIDVRLSSAEVAIRRLDTHELRITAMEKAATDAAASMKSLDMTLNGLNADMRVVKEILLRIEASQSGNASQSGR